MHLELLELVLIEPKRANLKLRPSKSRFFMQKVNYLEFTISKDGLQPNPDKVKAIAALVPPKGKDDTKRFIAMVSYYRCFIRDFGKIASCLFQLTKKDATFVMTEETLQAFDDLRKCN